MKQKTIAVDLDGILCEEGKTFDRVFAKPILNNINKVNKLYELGHLIIIFTARSWAEYKITEYWLKLHNVKYNAIVCGKPNYDVFIDDRARFNFDFLDKNEI